MTWAYVLGGIAWWVSGTTGFLYWWSTAWGWDHPPVWGAKQHLPHAAVIGALSGPSAWIMGYFVHRGDRGRYLP